MQANYKHTNNARRIQEYKHESEKSESSVGTTKPLMLYNNIPNLRNTHLDQLKGIVRQNRRGVRDNSVQCTNGWKLFDAAVVDRFEALFELGFPK